MSALTRTIITTNEFILQELPEAIRTDEATILVQAGHSGDVLPFTLMGRAAVSGKWIVPYNPAAVDGSAVTPGIYLGETILEADIQAGDIVDAPILKYGARCDEEMLVIEGAVTLASVIGATVEQRQLRDLLIDKSLFFQTTAQIMDTY